MKILHVSKKYPNALGGDAVVVANLVKQQTNHGQYTSVLTSNCSEIDDNNQRVYKFGLHDSAEGVDRISIRRLVSLIFLFFKAVSVIKQERPDIIHTHSIDMAFVVSFAARHYNVPLVHTFHVLTFDDPRQGIFRTKIELMLLKRTNPARIFVLGPGDVDKIKLAGFDNVYFVPNGVNTSDWHVTNSVKKNKLFTFIAVGRLEEQKGFRYLIEAASMLKKENHNFQVLIVGEGSQQQTLSNLIHLEKLDAHVYLLGLKTPEELRELYAKSHVFVLPSLWEGMPLTLLEAWASGLPSICTNVNSIPYVADRISLLVDPLDPGQLFANMQLIMKDAALCMKLKQKSLMQVEKFNWESVSEQLIAQYSEVIQPKIIQISAYYPPHIGGVEKRVEELTTHLSNRRYQLDVFTSNIGARRVAHTHNYVKFLPAVEFAHTPIMPTLPLVLIGVKKPALIHLHIAQVFTPEITAFIARLRHIPYITHIRMDLTSSGKLGVFLPIYKKMILGPVIRGSSRTIVNTPDYVDLVASKFKENKHKIVVIPNATNFQIGLTPRSIHNKVVRLVFVGRLVDQKNPLLLLEAFRLLKQSASYNFHLTIVGDGQLRSLAEEYTRENNLNQDVRFVGYRTGKGLEKEYENADIFILTSRAESFGTVLIEAMAKGLPIVASRIPAVRNVTKDGQNALLVNQNPEAFAKAVERLVNDKQLYTTMSKNNLTDAKKFNWENTVDKFIQVYETIS